MDHKIQLKIDKLNPYFVEVVGLSKCICILRILDVDNTINQRFSIGISKKAKDAIVIVDKKYKLSKLKNQHTLFFNPTDVIKDINLDVSLESSSLYIQSYVILNDFRGVESSYTGLPYQTITVQDMSENSFTIGLHNSEFNDNNSVLIKIEILTSNVN